MNNSFSVLRLALLLVAWAPAFACETPLTLMLSISNGMKNKTILVESMQDDPLFPLPIAPQKSGTVTIDNAHKSAIRDIRVIDQKTLKPLLYITLGKNLNPVHESAFEHVVATKKSYDYFLRMSSSKHELVNSWRFEKKQIQNPAEPIELELNLALRNEPGESFSKFSVQAIKAKNLNNFVIDPLKNQKTIIPIREDYFK